jgi:hypothetical protein
MSKDLGTETVYKTLVLGENKLTEANEGQWHSEYSRPTVVVVGKDSNWRRQLWIMGTIKYSWGQSTARNMVLGGAAHCIFDSINT